MALATAGPLTESFLWATASKDFNFSRKACTAPCSISALARSASTSRVMAAAACRTSLKNRLFQAQVVSPSFFQAANGIPCGFGHFIPLTVHLNARTRDDLVAASSEFGSLLLHLLHFNLDLLLLVRGFVELLGDASFAIVRSVS